MSTNLAADLELRAASDPDVVALTFEDGRCWTYAGLDAAAQELAGLFEKAGIGAGDRVAVQLPNSPELVVALLGSWKAGAVPVVMSGLYNATEVEKCIAQVAPAMAISVASRSETVSRLAVDVVQDVATRYEGTAASHRHDVRHAPAVGADAEGIVLFTGGTTGVPKAVALTHTGTRESMSNLVRAQKGRPGPLPTAGPGISPNLLALPLFHSGGFQSMLVAWHLGRSAVLLERFSVERLARVVPQYRIDNLFLLPTMVYDLVMAEDEPDLSSVRRVLVAGQRLDPGLQRAFEERYGVMVLSNYGSTELGHVAGWTGPDIKAGLWRPGAVGRVYDGVRLEIRDDHGHALPSPEVGEIWVRSARTLGYVGKDGPVADDLVSDGWIRSGDVGYLDADGVLFLVGRQRELIKTGGFQVWPGELEQVVRELPDVLDVVVVGSPDARLGEVAVAVVVSRPGANPEELGEQVIAHCRSRLAHYKAVRAVRVVDAIPRSEAGKVRRDRVEADVLTWMAARV